MKKTLKQLISFCLAAIMCVCMAPMVTGTARAANVEYYDDYSTLDTIYNYNGCTGLQGMDIDGDYLYSIKINSSTGATALITRTHKDTGSTIYMTDASSGSIYFSYLSHGNGLDFAEVAGEKHIFVATTDPGTNSVVRMRMDGTTVSKIGGYRALYDGEEIYISGVQVVSVNDSEVKLLLKKGKYYYYTTIDANSTGGDMILTHAFTLDVYDVTINGVSRDLSSFLGQGFEYIDGKIYVSMTGTDPANESAIMVFDIEGVSGTIKNDPTLSFWIESSTYANKFEIEDCAISPADGILYFNTNRAKTSSDGDYDGVHYIQDYVYNPARTTAGPGNYRWETKNDRLVSVTTGGAVYNSAYQKTGIVSGGTMTDAQFSLNKSVILEHDRPWILEWKSSGAWTDGGLLFAEGAISEKEGGAYIFRRKNSSLIAFGEYTDGTFHNYGITLSDYGIDGTATHVYSLRNRIAEDGANMVYLFVDGKELGALNNYHIGGTSQGSTSDWISGRDFTFSYIGTPRHPIDDCVIEYIQVWANGILDQVDEPDNYRWETQDDVLTSVAGFDLTLNEADMLSGSCAGGEFTDAQFRLEKPVVLLHDRPWSVEWQSEGGWSGGPMLFAASGGSMTANAPFFYRRQGSTLFAFGMHDGTKFNNYGINLSDHGINGTVSHVYRLTNRVNADGSNMVYLYVDGEELGAMNHYHVGGSSQGTTSNWISGKDFSFTYLGTAQQPINDCSIDYLQVWEGGRPSDYEPKNYRWETQNDALVNISSNRFADNSLTVMGGSCTDDIFSGTYFRMEEPVILRHDQPWAVQWQSEGSWKEIASGALLFSASNTHNALNAPFLYRRNDSQIIAFGHRNNNRHENYGISLADHGIDGTQPHVYKVENRIAADGSNMAYLLVDGKELGAMNNFYVGGVAQGTTSDWISGKDFVFSYMGTAQFPIGNCSIEYIQVFENCSHTFPDWTIKNATCTADGLKTRTCSECGVVETEVLPATGHSYTAKTVDGNCQQYAHVEHTCSNCGDTYNTYDDSLMSAWSATKPNVDASLIETKTQYRYSDYETKTSYNTSLSGYTQIGSKWDTAGTSGSVQYVNSWPSGFSTSNSLYSQYNKKSSKVTAGETDTLKTVINSDISTGYLYYHWCYADSYYSQANSSGSYTTFHAYYDTTDPDSYTCDTSDMSYCTASSNCSNSDWWFVTEVNTQKYTTYKKLFTYERWTDWSDWSDAAVEATDKRKVEAQTLYRYVNGEKGDHTWVDGVCDLCGETCQHPSYENGSCTVCGKAEPVVIKDFYLFGYINGQNYACEEDYMNIGTYKFVDGKLTVAFTETSYVGVKTGDNENWYMTNGWQGEVNSTTLYNTTTLGTNADKLYVPGGVEVTFTLMDNGNDTFTLSYAPATVEKPEITLKYPTLSFEGEVFYNVYFTASNVGDVEEMGLLTWYTKPSSLAAATFENAEYTIPGSVYSSANGTYMVRTQGIPAKQLGDNLFLRVYAKLSDGSYVYSGVTYYNAKYYANDILTNSQNANMKSLVVAMLNYGAAAQVHFNHNADKLMNAGLTDEQKALVKNFSSDMISTVVTPNSAKTVNFKSNGGFSNGYPSVSFEGAFTINYYLAPTKAVEGEMTLYCWDLNTYNSVSALTEANATAKVTMAPASNPAEYFGNYTGIAAKQIDETVFVAGVYTSGGVRYSSPVLRYSLSAYCAEQIEKGSATMQDFAKATVVYGDAAKTYFANLR